MRIRARMQGHIDGRFGFAQSDRGELFEIHRKDFRKKPYYHDLKHGTLVEFDTSEPAFDDALLSGKFRDEDLDGGHRNPRRPKVSSQHKRARDIAIIPEESK